MATVKAFIRVAKKKSTSAKVRFRLSDGRNKQLFHTSDMTVDPNVWDSKNEAIKAKVVYDDDKRLDFNSLIVDRKKLILEIYNSTPMKERLTTKWLEDAIDRKLHPQKFSMEESNPETLCEWFGSYMEEYRGKDRMKQHYAAVKRTLMRFVLYQQKLNPHFTLTLENTNGETLRQFEDFLKNEYKYFDIYKDIYESVPDSRPPKQRGQNRINKVLTYVRTFFRWSIKNELTKNYPFANYKIGENVYGTPIYISIEERNDLYNFDLSEYPNLAIQRDVFVFQCVIGCRVGDLMKLTKGNVIRDAIEYIPRKTKDGRPDTLRVPLNRISKEIISRYAQTTGEKLLPFIAEQNYNYAIKDIFKLAGLTRMVTIINTITGDEEKKPLNEVASSHLARRTFAGNLYKQVKDPNLVGSLTGHKEGSKAFARYREIDEDIKTDLVKLLE